MANALVTREWTVGLYGDQKPDLTELLASIEAIGAKVAEGDRADLERMLASQAITLNTAFASLISHTLRCKLVANFETCARLALRAQAQSRAAIETFAQMKMPTVFARQANIANGHQQVNNVMGGEPSRAGAVEAAPNKLLEAHGERLDTGTATEASRGDPEVVPVAILHRPADRTG